MGRDIRPALPSRVNSSRGNRASSPYDAARGASSWSAMSRVSSMRSYASAVGSSRSTTMSGRLAVLRQQLCLAGVIDLDVVQLDLLVTSDHVRKRQQLDGQ